MLDFFWLVLLFPALGAAANGLLGKYLSHRLIATIGCGAILLSFLVSLVGFLELANGLEAWHRLHLFTWIEAGPLKSEFALLIDPLSLLMLLVVTGVGLLIHVYSVAYMETEAGFYRYFCYLNLFIVMMCLLVLADNYLLMFVGWEGVGLCSFLLIGYYFEKKSAGDAAKKAFIVNRIGDVGFVLGLFLLFQHFGSLQYSTIFDQAAADSTQLNGVLTAATLLLFVGAVGKSAQLPLYVWLPDAMEGPTPVSALIHAATMVTAGVYMIARSAALFSRAPTTMLVVATVGLLTALVAALIAVAQRDIKRVLAYSTVSQLGYMFLALGVGAFGAGIFHLFTHAFFKALLFLGSGSVILALHHQQDLFRMGGLRKYLPRTYLSMLIGTAAIAGVPLFSGFFSKDEILWQAFSSPYGGWFYWVMGVVVAGLTAFYMFRLILLAFHGEERFHPPDRSSEGGHAPGVAGHIPREPSLLVTGPLLLLALFSLAAGWIGLPAWTGSTHQLEHFLAPVFSQQLQIEPGHHSVSQEIVLMLVVIAVAGIGILLAQRLYLGRPEAVDRLAARFGGTYRLLRGKFYVDEIYETVLITPLRRFSRGVLWKSVDVGLVDGAVNGLAALVQQIGQTARLIQNGQSRAYAAWILTGAALLCAYLWIAR